MFNFFKSKVRYIRPEIAGTFIGAGLFYKGKKYITHNKLSYNDSAVVTFVYWQKLLLLSFLILVIIGLFLDPILTSIILIAIATSAYFIDLVFTFFVLQRSLHTQYEYKFRRSDFKKIKNSELPIYSILCPLYKESGILLQFVQSIDRIDWPKNKLDVILLLEEDDNETIKIARSLNLPSYFRIIVVPHSMPKTKPKACNLGLEYAKGEYLVIYDAEDKPDPLQLKKAYIVFQNAPDEVVCLQSKLNYYNSNQNLLTQLFTAEYSLWFDLVLPGLQSIKAPIPLGGTSNHFKTQILKSLGGWDPFNVTEDCDLGTRLFKAGFSTAIIDSTTYEEANSKFKGWLKQRSRWIKGYIQTYLVHTRDPLNFFRNFGIYAFIFQLVIGMRMIFMVINPVLWLMTLTYFVFRPVIGPTIESLYPAPVYYIAIFCLVFGNFIYFYNYMLGSARRNLWHVVKYVFFIPFYWAMASISAMIAIKQLIFNPHYWEKTEHGHHLNTGSKIRMNFRFLTPVAGILKLIASAFKLLNFFRFIVGKVTMDVLEILEPLPYRKAPEYGKYNILIYNWRDTKHIWAGGAEVYIQKIAENLRAKGHNVTIFCGWDGRGKRNEKINGVDVIRRGGFYTVYLMGIIYYFIKFRKRFDLVVDCENGIPFFTPFYIRKPKFLVIHHVHQEVFRKHLRFPLKQIALYLESNLMPLVYRNVQVITISQSSKNDILDRKWVKEERIEIVPPAVDVSQFKPMKKTTNPSFIYLGRLMPWKNVDVAVKAFAKVAKNYPDSQLIIAGFGESLPYLKQLTNALELDKKVFFLGYIPEESKSELYARCWAAIQPSSFEGWGITVIEANSAATPVIASDIKGLRDSVINQRTGILFPVGDVNKLAEHMQNLIVNSELRQYLSNEGLLWSKNFSWSFSALQFEKVILANLALHKIQPAYDFVTSES